MLFHLLAGGIKHTLLASLGEDPCKLTSGFPWTSFTPGAFFCPFSFCFAFFHSSKSQPQVWLCWTMWVFLHIHWNGVWSWGPQHRVQTSSFRMWISSCPRIICWKDFSLLLCFGILLEKKSIDSKWRGSFLDSQFDSVPVKHCLDYCSFVVSFWNWEVNPPTLFFSFIIVLWILRWACQLLGRSQLWFW